MSEYQLLLFITGKIIKQQSQRLMYGMEPTYNVKEDKEAETKV